MTIKINSQDFIFFRKSMYTLFHTCIHVHVVTSPVHTMTSRQLHSCIILDSVWKDFLVSDFKSSIILESDFQIFQFYLISLSVYARWHITALCYHWREPTRTHSVRQPPLWPIRPFVLQLVLLGHEPSPDTRHLESNLVIRWRLIPGQSESHSVLDFRLDHLHVANPRVSTPDFSDFGHHPESSTE